MIHSPPRSEPTPPEAIDATSDEAIERRVIAALTHPEQALMRALQRDGISVKAVNACAVRIGLTADLVKNCRLTGVLPAMRSCVQCDTRFLSAGPHNRMCKRCLSR